MQKRVVGDEQEHVVLDVMVHIPVQVVIDWVYVDGAAIEPVVEHVLGKTGVLCMAVNHHEPGSEETRQADIHQAYASTPSGFTVITSP